MFFRSGYGEKTKHSIFGKNVRSPRTLFFLENTAFFRSETENERAERAKLRAEVERLQGGRSEQSQGRQSRCRNRAERAKGGGRRPKGDDRANGERAERASIYRPSEAASNSAEEKCSLFVVSSPLWGGSNAPHWRRDGKETERNGGRIVFAVICSRIRGVC